jgi:hypothetical protein
MKLGDKVKFEIEGFVTDILPLSKEVRITAWGHDYYVPIEKVELFSVITDTLERRNDVVTYGELIDAMIYALENCKGDFKAMLELYQAEVMTNGSN